jgi:hypothetical protein
LQKGIIGLEKSWYCQTVKEWGVSITIGKVLLEQADERQPVTTYTWPDDDPDFIDKKLTELGFKSTGDTPDRPIFGPGTKVRQRRMQAVSAGDVLHNFFYHSVLD